MTALETSKHIEYIQKLGKVCLSPIRTIPTEDPTTQNTDDLAYHLTSHLRMNAVYWGFTAVSILGQPTALERDDMIEFVMSCWDKQEGMFSPPETYSKPITIDPNRRNPQAHSRHFRGTTRTYSRLFLLSRYLLCRMRWINSIKIE